MMKKQGVEVDVFMDDEGYHGIEMVYSIKAHELINECMKLYDVDDVQRVMYICL